MKPMNIQTKHLGLELKVIGDTGEFEGLAAIYGLRDDMGDIIEKGAFTRTIHQKKGQFPIFFQHKLDEPLGFGDVSDEDAGLRIRGQLNLEVGRARETHALMKQAKARGVSFGLSIGYDAIRHEWRGSTRHLQEVRLWEISPTLLPAQSLAVVQSVKQREGKPFGEFEDFDACVAANQDKDSPEGFCAFLHHQITGEWPTESAALHGSLEECVAANQDQDDPEAFCAALLAKGADLKARADALFTRTITLSRAEVARYCPSCAQKMARHGQTALILSPKTVKQMPPELLAGLCDKYMPDPGFFTACVADPPSEISDPEAFCAWLHEQCTGIFPGEHEGASLPMKAARHLLGEVARILEARGAATLAARALEVKALLDVDPGTAPSMQDPAAEMAFWALMRRIREEARRISV